MLKNGKKSGNLDKIKKKILKKPKTKQNKNKTKTRIKVMHENKSFSK